MINNKGPSIELCGTPTVIGRISDFVSSNSTLLFSVFLDNFLEGVEMCHEYHNILI